MSIGFVDIYEVISYGSNLLLRADRGDLFVNWLMFDQKARQISIKILKLDGLSRLILDLHSKFSL